LPGREVDLEGQRGEVDEVFRALANGSRRQLLDRLNERNGQSLEELCDGMNMVRQSVSKHLAILEEANLVTVLRRGRRRLHYLNPVPINEIAERWIGRYEVARVRALHNLKQALEELEMEKPEFVYKTYIRTTPQQLWKALTKPSFTQNYWGVTFETDWRSGSTMTWTQGDVKMSDPEQVVVDSEPFRRLSYTWHTFTSEWAEHNNYTDEVLADFRSGPRSKVTFDLEAIGDLVKLTVVHDGFEPGSSVLASISEGWPVILSSLKTVLETGTPLAL
jgi:DNA-binding transcriptional ArsR family regulator/uncharacterized protein YndB with AHSA1/START domain